MNSLKALVKRVLRDLDAEYKVDISLADFPDVDTDFADEALSKGAQFLRRRARDLHEAETALSTVSEQLLDELEQVGLSEFGWASLRSKIEASLSNDEISGLKMWLETWLKAAAHGRHAAFDRLFDDVRLPEFAQTLRDRAYTSAAGIRRCDYYLSEPMISAGIEGFELDGEAIPSVPVRERLQLVKLRLAINADLDDGLIETLFTQAEASTDQLTLAALRARWDRVSGLSHEDHEPAFTIEEATNLDVAIELILNGRDEQSTDFGFAYAQKAVDAISLLRRPWEVIEASLTSVPPEVWIVAAERAVAEENRTAFDYCLDSVGDTEGLKEYFWGRYYLARAKGYEAFGESADTRAGALRSACTNFLYTTELALAYQCAREAHDLCPDDIDLLMVLADAIRFWAYEKPIAEYRAEVEAILETFYAAFDRGEPTTRQAWCHSIVSGLYLLLARPEDTESEEHKWQAFIAAARGVLADQEHWPSWTALAAASLHLELERLDLVFARTAHLVDENLTTLDDLSRALFNAADFDALEEVLDPKISDYSAGIKVFLLFAQQEYEAAIDQFTKFAITPRYTWAWECCISSAFMLGRANFAIKQSNKYREYWMGFEEESDRENAIALHYFLTGQFEKARDTLMDVSSSLSGGGQLSLGFYEIVTGNEDAGLDRLSKLAQTSNSTILTTLWTVVTKNWMSTVAETHGAQLPDFSEIDSAFEKRAAQLQAGMTPERELQLIDTRDTAYSRSGKTLARAMLALAKQNEAEARRILNDSRNDLTSRDLAFVQASLTDEQKEELAPGAAEDSTEGQTFDDTDEMQAAPTIHLFVCADWFEDHNDPLKTHPMFLRWLPEARVWTPELPAVQVKVNDMFDPGDYEIEIDGVVTESGHIPDDQALYREGSERLFGLPEQAAFAVEDGIVAFSSRPRNGALPELLKLSTQEILIRRLSQCVRSLSPVH